MIDEAYVINLDGREERMDHARKEMKKAGFHDFDRFSAVNGFEHPDRDEYDINPGALGCALSHLGVFETCGDGIVAVFEDDVVFEENFRPRFERWIQELPSDWELCYIGGYNSLEPEPHSEHIDVVKRTLSTHAYITTPEARRVISNRLHSLDNPLDVIYNDLQKERTWHILNPRLAFQRPGESDITGEYEDYRHLHRDEN